MASESSAPKPGRRGAEGTKWARGCLERLLLLGVGLVLALGVLELGARMAGVQLLSAPELRTDRPRTKMYPHPDRRHPFTPAEGGYLKVAAIGDSFTAGHGNQVDDAWPARLERLLNLNAGVEPVEVRSFARGGTSAADHEVFFDKAVEWGADLIVYGIFLNDTEDSTDPHAREWAERRAPREPEGRERWLAERSHLAGWIFRRIEAAREHRVELAYMHYLFTPGEPPWELYKGHLEHFAALCHDEKIPWVAVVFPPMIPFDPDRYPLDFAHEQIHAELERLEVPYFDLLPIYRQRSAERLAAIPGKDSHPNEIGHRIASEAIFLYLIDQHFVGPEYKPMRVKEGRGRRQGLPAAEPAPGG